MPPVAYSPARGHFVRTDFTPHAGHERGGPRPALVLSDSGYNARTGLAVFCPVTGRGKGYLFEVPIPAGLAVYGVVLADSIKCLDRWTRGVQYLCDAPAELLEDALDRVAALLGIPRPAPPTGG